MLSRSGPLIAAIVATAAAGAVIAKPGRVVRVERATASVNANIRICNFNRAGGAAKLTCIGKEAYQIGDVFAVLSEDGSFARAEATAIKPAQFDPCNLGFAVDIEARVYDELPAPAKSTGFSRTFGVLGVDVTPGVSKILSPSQRVRSPSGNAGDGVMVAIDADNDQEAEVMVSLSDCPKAKRAAPFVSGGRSVTSYCIDYWQRSGTEWKKASSEAFHFCQ